MSHCSAVPRNVAGTKVFALKHTLQNFADPESEPVGLGESGNFRFAITRAQYGAELAVAVDTLIVHLDGDDAFEFRPNFFETVRQRMQVTQMERAALQTFFARAFGRVV